MNTQIPEKKHKHDWDDAGFVIDTMPPQYCYTCKNCGKVTHDPSNEDICKIKHYGS